MMNKKKSIIVLEEVAQRVLDLKLFNFKGINLFPLVYWYFWVFLESKANVKTLKKKKPLAKILNFIKIILEVLSGLLLYRQKNFTFITLSPRSTLSYEYTFKGKVYLEPLTDYTFSEINKFYSALNIDVDGFRGLDIIDVPYHLKREVKSVAQRYFMIPFMLKSKKRLSKDYSAFEQCFQADFNKLIEDTQIQEIFASLNFNFDVESARQYLNHFMKLKIRDVKFAEYLIEKIRPKAIFIVNEYGNMPFVLVAKKFKIKTFALQHGVIHINHPGYIYPKNYVNEVPLCDKLFVFGHHEKKLLVEQSIFQYDKVEVVGCPRMINNYYSRTIYDRKKILSDLSIRTTKKIILYVSTGGWDDVKADFDLSEYLMSEFKILDEDYILVIKMHPVEKSRNYYIKKAKLYGIEDDIRVVKDFDLYALLYVSDYVVGNISTALSEAVSFRKKVLIYEGADDNKFIDYLNMGVALDLMRFNSLSDAFTFFDQENDFTIQLNLNIDKFIKEFYFRIDNKPVGRIIDSLRSDLMLRSKS